MAKVFERVYIEEYQIILKIQKFHPIPPPSVILRKHGSHNFTAFDNNSVSQHQVMISRQFILAYIQSR
jgi:hypothetical protein